MIKIDKLFFVLLLTLFFISCGQNNKAQPEIELINQEVFYVEIEPYDSNLGYDISEQRINATNLITFKVSNPTKSKILFNISNDSFLYPFDGIIEKSKEPGMYFIIKDSISIAQISIPLINFVEESYNDVAVEIFFYNDSIRKMKYKRMGVYIKNIETVDHFIRNKVILNPNETRMFHVLLKLPIRNEVNFSIGEVDFDYINEINKFNKFQLYYSADAAYIKTILPEYLLKELEENQIEIFDGVLMSNEIPLLKR